MTLYEDMTVADNCIALKY